VKTGAGAEATRVSVITAKKIEFDNKEGVILFDEDVLVDDEQFVMRSDRLLVFMVGTNDVQQIMAVGRVTITNENRSASCSKAVYTKKDGQIVMTGDARLMQQGKESGSVAGERIVIWLDDARMEVTPGRVVLPPGTFNKGDRKLLP
jgi:lipopolysaccharide transport protein LptA